MIKSTLFIIVFISIYGVSSAQPWKIHGKLLVSDSNPHYIRFQDGTPFFWFGDTGWALFRVTRLRKCGLIHAQESVLLLGNLKTGTKENLMYPASPGSLPG